MEHDEHGGNLFETRWLCLLPFQKKVHVQVLKYLGSLEEDVSTTPIDLVSFVEVQGRCCNVFDVLKMAQILQPYSLFLGK